VTLPTRDQLNLEVDRRFREFFPGAPQRLDPDDPDQADLVKSWVGIRDGILDDWTDETLYTFFPGIRGQKLNPNDAGDGQLIEYWKDIHDQIRDGAPGQFNWDGAPADSSASATTSTSPATSPAAPGVPDVGGDSSFAEEFKTWAHRTMAATHGAASIIEIASYWASEGSTLLTVAEFTNPIGYAVMAFDLLSDVIEAFGGGLDREESRGVVFGLVWETIGHPDLPRQPMALNSVGLPDDPLHSDERSAEAFDEGVRKGRAKAKDPEVRYDLGIAIAGTMAKDNLSIDRAANLVLNELFRQFGHTRFEDIEYP
jgi:hypothetical protein